MGRWVEFQTQNLDTKRVKTAKNALGVVVARQMDVLDLAKLLELLLNVGSTVLKTKRKTNVRERS